jgi:enoyl-CoA hydratase/carnithine racemase
MAWSTAVVDAGTALDGARALAEEILAGSPTSVRASLQVMDETAGIPDTVDAIRHTLGGPHAGRMETTRYHVSAGQPS